MTIDGQRLTKRARKGIVGIEAAIVLIAFVIIAAALSYVVVNMGFFASQKAKDTISRGIEEATSALQLDGSVIAKTNDTRAAVSYIIIPVKLSVGKESVDLSKNTTVVSVQISGNYTDYMSNIYDGIANKNDYVPTNLTSTLENLFAGTSEPKAYFAIENNDDDRGASLTIEREVPAGLNTNKFVDLG